MQANASNAPKAREVIAMLKSFKSPLLIILHLLIRRVIKLPTIPKYYVSNTFDVDIFAALKQSISFVVAMERNL